MDDFRGHPVGCSLETIELAVDAEDHFGSSEVSEFADPLSVDQNVGGLDIPVDDLVGVEVLKPLEDLFGVQPDQLLRKRSIFLDH